ncbi:hypothetical protein OHS33_35185 [Streptomyces sp. NBC_00536]|uniref:hypothetical protein n=1 Tax=Streptomyces sp. NBC_00536 TaxID=2975769 RepID=UPI002E8156E2|nr:hypothetical protein [Streptomyces sp. NBC_00536]WUC83158.1 hypothetical protein OHS33_35185 [Streptomyces sp. NBC_00536]
MHLGTKREGSRKPYLLDLAGWKTGAYAGSWKWQETGARAIHKRRMHSNATILPTGEILVTGGIDYKPPPEIPNMPPPPPPPDRQAVHNPEIYNPVPDSSRARG